MKFSAQLSDLKAILPKVTAVIPTRSTLAQLENIQLELKAKKLTMMATDLEISVRSSIEVASKTDGLIAITSRRLSDIIRSLPDGDLSFSLDKTTRRVTLQTATGNYTMVAAESILSPCPGGFGPSTLPHQLFSALTTPPDCVGSTCMPNVAFPAMQFWANVLPVGAPAE